jgi:hypothetical protein
MFNIFLSHEDMMLDVFATCSLALASPAAWYHIFQPVSHDFEVVDPGQGFQYMTDTHRLHHGRILDNRYSLASEDSAFVPGIIFFRYLQPL